MESDAILGDRDAVLDQARGDEHDLWDHLHVYQPAADALSHQLRIPPVGVEPGERSLRVEVGREPRAQVWPGLVTARREDHRAGSVLELLAARPFGQHPGNGSAVGDKVDYPAVQVHRGAARLHPRA
jgi:hypothetical protein